MPFEIRNLGPDQLASQMNAFVALLEDSVNNGASIGFLPQLDPITAVSYWHELSIEMEDGHVVLLAAYDGDILLGSVQLALCTRANGTHRAEVNKLMVHTTARGMGLGKQLMAAVEKEARRRGLTLLVLDTRKGDASEALYRRIGYAEAGEIPRYARSASGELHTTVVFWKELA
ncbi:MAG: GNAT family N-acetyltransferase [Bryobacterales bacterium]|nr:GNAT family N-acetyltransferase [Bryobacterales bacterium]